MEIEWGEYWGSRYI